MEGSYQKFAKDVLVIGATNILTVLSSIILLPIITKTLGVYSYGIWVQVQVIVSVAMGLVGLGLPFAMTRFLPAMTNTEEIKEDFYSVFCIVFLASGVLSLILIVVADFIANAFFEGETNIVRITALIILVSSLDWVYLGFYRSFRQMKKYAYFIIGDTCIQIGLIAYLVLGGYGLFSIILAVLIVRLLMFAILSILTISQLGVKRPHFINTKNYLIFGLPTIPGNVFAWAVASSDKYIIAYFLGAASVGIYSAVYALGTIPLIFATVIGFVLPPVLSKSYDEGKMDELKTHLRYSLKYYLAIAIPFVLGSLVLAKPVLNLFSTTEVANDGYYIVPIVALGILFGGSYAVISNILVVTKKTKTMGLIWIIAGVVNVGLNFFIVPLLGILGAALTTLFAYFLVLIIGGYFSFKEFKFGVDWQFVIKSIFASFIMALVVWQMNPLSGLFTIVSVLVGISIYGFALLLLKAFKREEYIFFRSLLRRNVPATDINEKVV